MPNGASREVGHGADQGLDEPLLRWTSTAETPKGQSCSLSATSLAVPASRLAASVPTMRILVRNMSRETTEKDVRDLFEPFGSVQSCVIVNDAESGRSKGFGFVVMPKAGDAKAAIQQLNGQVLDGEILRVKRAT